MFGARPGPRGTRTTASDPRPSLGPRPLRIPLRAGCLAHARRKLFEQREHPRREKASMASRDHARSPSAGQDGVGQRIPGCHVPNGL
jgi:hypothetical protein